MDLQPPQLHNKYYNKVTIKKIKKTKEVQQAWLQATRNPGHVCAGPLSSPLFSLKLFPFGQEGQRKHTQKCWLLSPLVGALSGAERPGGWHRGGSAVFLCRKGSLVPAVMVTGAEALTDRMGGSSQQ